MLLLNMRYVKRGNNLTENYNKPQKKKQHRDIDLTNQCLLIKL